MKENMGENTDDKIEIEIDRDPVYYYSREHRLGRASQTVRALNEEEPTRPGLAKTIFGTRSNIFLFVSISMICAMFIITSRLSTGERTIKLGGNSVSLTISREEGAFVLGMVKNSPKKGEAYTGDVWFVVSPVLPKSNNGAQPEVFTDYVTFFPIGYEVFRFSLPFDANIESGDKAKSDAFYVVLRAGTEQKTLKINVRQNE